MEIRGEIRQPGPAAETWFVINVQQLPLDDRFRQACKPEVQDVLRQINLTGWADASLSLYRPPGFGQEFITRLGMRLTNCEILLEAFPYRLTNLSGDVTLQFPRAILVLHRTCGASTARRCSRGWAIFSKRSPPAC